MDSSRHLVAGPSLVPSRVSLGGVGPSHSSSASGVFYQGDGQSPAPTSSVSGTVRSSLGPAGDMNHGAPNSTANSSGPSIGASSLVTDANSALSGGPQLQRSTSINNESYMRLPASPMSFSSNNISGSSVMDGSSIVQQSPHQEQMKRGASSITSQSIKQEPGLVHTQKKPRLDSRQDDVLQQQVIQQLLQRQESLQLQGHQSPQLNAIIQQQRLAQQRQQQQQHQMLQSLPHMQRSPLMAQSQQLRPSHPQMTAMPPARRPSDSGLCARRLMQYMYHQRHRPADNSILYWRKFVAEYFASRAKKRWCLSLYDNVGSHALGAFPQAAMDVWQCDICHSKSGKGFEATYEVLPRLSQIKFDRGVIDELLFLDNPCEWRLSSGIMVLEYAKAIQESVYEQLRVVREGRLRITFTPDLKIMAWEFCARRHEEFFSRRAVAPQVNQLLQVAHKYQTTVNESGSSGVSPQDLQSSCSMFMSAGRQLARSLELQSLNDLGFSKRYVRCLQIAEVVNSLFDLIDFSQENKMGPIESLKSYPRQAAAKLQAQKMQEVEHMASAQSLSADQNTLNKIMSMHPGLGSHTSNNHTTNHIVNNTPQSAVALNSYQYLLRSSSNPNLSPLQPSSFNCPTQSQPVPFAGKLPPFNGLSAPNQQQSPSNSSLTYPANSIQPSQVNQHLEQHVIQQLLQDMMNNSKGTPQQSFAAPNANGSAATEEVVGPAVGGTGGSAGRLNTGLVGNDLGLENNGAAGMAPSRSNSFKSAANNNNSSSSSSSFSAKPDLLQNLHLPELDQDILQEFTESGIQW